MAATRHVPRHAVSTKARNTVLAAGFTLAVAAGTGVAVTSISHADPSTDLRSGCERTDVDFNVQKCQVYSPSMGRSISVAVRPAHTANNPKVVQFLDGMTIFDDTSGWLRDGHAAEHLADLDATLVFPTGDSESFYADWDHPTADGRTMMYKTFLTEELPAWLERADTFGVPGGGRGHTGVTGLSMGGYGALSLASQRPDLYASVLALSGFYNTLSPAQALVTDAAPLFGETGSGPWSTLDSRLAANPMLHLDKLTMPVIITASSGVANLAGDMGPDPLATVVKGTPLETGSLVFTSQMQVASAVAGRDNIRFVYDIVGAHAWDTWNRAAWDRGLMNEMILHL